MENELEEMTNEEHEITKELSKGVEDKENGMAIACPNKDEAAKSDNLEGCINELEILSAEEKADLRKDLYLAQLVFMKINMKIMTIPLLIDLHLLRYEIWCSKW